MAPLGRQATLCAASYHENLSCTPPQELNSHVHCKAHVLGIFSCFDIGLEDPSDTLNGSSPQVSYCGQNSACRTANYFFPQCTPIDSKTLSTPSLSLEAMIRCLNKPMTSGDDCRRRAQRRHSPFLTNFWGDFIPFLSPLAIFSRSNTPQGLPMINGSEKSRRRVWGVKREAIVDEIVLWRELTSRVMSCSKHD